MEHVRVEDACVCILNKNKNNVSSRVHAVFRYRTECAGETEKILEFHTLRFLLSLLSLPSSINSSSDISLSLCGRAV